MFYAGHAAAGALIGQQLQGHFPLIMLLALVSHFLMDLIPHGDYHHVQWYFSGRKEKFKKIYQTIVVDATATIIMVSILLAYVPLNRASVAWGIIWGVVPDLLVGLSELMKNKWLNAFSKFHFIIHDAIAKKIKVKPLPGALGQLALIGIMLYALGN